MCCGLVETTTTISSLHTILYSSSWLLLCATLSLSLSLSLSPYFWQILWWMGWCNLEGPSDQSCQWKWLGSGNLVAFPCASLGCLLSVVCASEGRVEKERRGRGEGKRGKEGEREYLPFTTCELIFDMSYNIVQPEIFEGSNVCEMAICKDFAI